MEKNGLQDQLKPIKKLVTLANISYRESLKDGKEYRCLLENLMQSKLYSKQRLEMEKIFLNVRIFLGMHLGSVDVLPVVKLAALGNVNVSSLRA